MYWITRQRLQYEDKLRKSNEELEQFAYVASHDLQEPLRKISSFSELLAFQYKGRLDAEADRYLEYVIDGAYRMQTQIKELLEYSRIDRQGKEFILTDCNEVLNSTLKYIHLAIDEAGATVTHDPLPTINADGAQLGQVFQNLITNAVKFRGAETPLVQISAEQRKKEWIFSVKDNGIGIAPEYAERIFVMFQRLHTRTEYPGTGLGLAICKKIVERHKGRIWVESKPGKGATFYFSIPARRNQERMSNGG
jgi:light-regulated signal transduction histidine kinase (bacteriophytochrome)